MHAIDLIRARSALIAVNQTSGELLKQLSAQAPTAADVGPILRAVTDCQAALKVVGDALMIEPSPRLPDTLDTTAGHAEQGAVKPLKPLALATEEPEKAAS